MPDQGAARMEPIADDQIGRAAKDPVKGIDGQFKEATPPAVRSPRPPCAPKLMGHDLPAYASCPSHAKVPADRAWGCGRNRRFRVETRSSQVRRVAASMGASRVMQS